MNIVSAEAELSALTAEVMLGGLGFQSTWQGTNGATRNIPLPLSEVGMKGLQGGFANHTTQVLCAQRQAARTQPQTH